MMTLSPRGRRLALSVHVTSSVSWIGALTVFLAHAVVGVWSRDEQLVRAVSLAMGVTAWFVILPLALAALASGVFQALGTAWGLVRHYWILFKLVLTVIATIVLLLKLEPISHLSEEAARASFLSGDLVELRTSLMLHAVGGLLVLLTVVTLAIHKPRGLIPYRLGRQRQVGGTSVDPESSDRTPRWVKAFVVVILGLLVILGAVMIGGHHGPGAHLA